jgi:hypothetical protein
MKAFVAGVLFLIVVGVGGFFWFQYTNKPSGSTDTTSFQTAAVTKVGIVQKSSGADYSHVIMDKGKAWGVTSYTVKLDEYVGKKVEATGQNSGTTLYIDTIKVVQ